MLTTFITALVDFSRRMAGLVVLFALLLTLGCGWFATTHFSINTDVNTLLSTDLPWRKQEATLEKAFPQNSDQTVIVIDGDNPDVAENAASALATKLTALPQQFSTVTRPDAIPFFRKHGLLYLSKDKIADVMDQIVQAQPMLGAITTDPSLRGFFGLVDLMLQGVAHGATEYAKVDKSFTAIAGTITAATEGKDSPLALTAMGDSAATPDPHELRKFILTQPVLNYSALQPGEASSDTIRTLIKDLNLTPDHGVRVRLTGSVPLNDEEFASVAEGTGTATIASGILVFVLLILALRSLRIIVPILITLVVGLVATTAFALAAIGSLNLISVAFAVMFIGIAVDFGIQFGVRYRDQRHQEPDHAIAMRRTAQIIAVPLAMAAASTALGFLAFIPTDYRGVSELGEIAGAGMIIAFFLNVTLLPALLSFTKPKSEPEAIGYTWAKPMDEFLLKHRRVILIATSVVAVSALIVTMQLKFDFDPLNLKDPKTESVSTLFDVMRDPDSGFYKIQMLRPSLAEAQILAAQLDTLPTVDHTMTLASFVPEDQTEKLAIIKDTQTLLAPTLGLTPSAPPPTDDEIISTIKKVADALQPLIAQHPSAANLAAALNAVLAKPDHDILQRLNTNIVTAMQEKLASVKDILNTEPVTIDQITEDLRRDWVTVDNRYLISVYPKGEHPSHDAIIAFTESVQSIAPDAAGTPISIRESGDTVTGAFIKAGIGALVAIALLAFVMLRKPQDVARLMAPLILAGILTLATIVCIGLPLNFANIIALPLLLSLGVSYAIYFVTYWRSGMLHPLQSSMARAVFFSAATVFVAFGSLALSAHPGTAGMGQLLTIALLYSLTCSFFLLPILLGTSKPSRN